MTQPTTLDWAPPALRIHRLRILNYRGVAVFDRPIPPMGVVIRGRNEAGKTSLLRAIRAAIQGQDVHPDAIMHGHDRAEILVDCGHVTATRVIEPSGQSLTVKEGAKKVDSPKAFLTKLFGSSTLDPLELLFEKDQKKRKERVLAALPVRVTPEHVASWFEGAPYNVSDRQLDYSKHGLTLVAELHAEAYSVRAERNKDLKRATGDVERAHEAWVKSQGALAAIAPAAVAAAMGIDTAKALRELGDVSKLLEEAQQTRSELQRRTSRIQAFELRTGATRKQIAKLRERAAELAAGLTGIDTTTVEAELIVPLEEATSVLGSHVAALRRTCAVAALPDQVTAARAIREHVRTVTIAAEHACTQLASLGETRTRMTDEQAKAAALADELEAGLAAGAEAPVTDLERAEADALVERRERNVRLATALRDEHAAAKTLNEAREAERAAGEVAGKLTALVNRLANDAPAQLIAESDTIPGLGIRGDDITLNGVGLDTISGRQRINLACEIARRASAKAKIIIADGLEALDPESMVHFVRHVTRDGYQLIGTRVDAGDVVLEAIEAKSDDETAEEEGEHRG